MHSHRFDPEIKASQLCVEAKYACSSSNSSSLFHHKDSSSSSRDRRASHNSRNRNRSRHLDSRHKSTSSAAASVPAKQVLPAKKMPIQLPYGGDLNAAMKARDREAIRQLMKVRDEVNTKQQIVKRTSN